MKKLLHIFSILAVLTLVSCNREEITAVPGEAITIIGTPSDFSTTDVYTKAIKSEEEGKITNMSLLIFDSDGIRRDGDLGIATYQEGSDFVFNIIRANFQAGYQAQLEHSQVYIFANIPASKKDDLIAVSTLGGLMAIDIPVDGIDEPESGFPMMGSIELNLKNDSAEKGVKQIPLVALYSKIVFNISVNPDQMDASDMPQRFQLNNWTVYNVPSKVRVGAPAANEPTANISSMIDASFTSNKLSLGSANPVSGAAKMSLSFYMPEHKINPNPANYSSYILPWAQENGYNAADYEDSGKYFAFGEYMQHFKPVLVGFNLDSKKPAQNATYVELDGTFYDHNNHSHNVVYTIFLGENNSDNFYINRDCQLNNNIVIRGISNNTYDENEGTVSYDWRVDVEKPEYDFGLERETLLDSHWEIRPIRLVLDGTKDEHRNAKIVLEISDPDVANNWIRLEMPSDSDIENNPNAYCAVGPSDLAYGKRRYFTDNLVTSTLNSANNKRIELYAVDGVKKEYTVWAYIDENTSVGTDTRKAIVHCRYYHNSTDETPKQTDDYAFMQRNLYPVSNSGHNYNIEYFEEYLYNFDSKDPYGQTTDGMPWGLDGVQLSSKNLSYVLSGTDVPGGLLTNFQNLLAPYTPYYDYYISSDEANGTTFYQLSGNRFTQIIAHRAGIDNNIGNLSTNDQPQSAIEYCFNKNKRESDGSVSSVKWYLPAIDEIQDIVVGGYQVFDVFQAKMYWSSQPAFHEVDFRIKTKQGGRDFTKHLFYDNVEYARATQAEYNGTGYTYANSGTTTESELDFSHGGTIQIDQKDKEVQSPVENIKTPIRDPGYLGRNSINRIRCVYTSTPDTVPNADF